MTSITVTTNVELDMAAIDELFKKEFEGWCPVCTDVMISEGEVLCCNCLKGALEYHINTCGCYP